MTATLFPHGPTLSSFLDDLLAMFENNPDGLVLDSELCDFFKEALIEGKAKAEALERFALAYAVPSEISLSASQRLSLASSTASIGNILVFPISNQLVQKDGGQDGSISTR